MIKIYLNLNLKKKIKIKMRLLSQLISRSMMICMSTGTKIPY